MMRAITLLVAGWLLLAGNAALAQATPPPPRTAETPPAVTVEPREPAASERRIEELRSELRDLLEESREGAEDMVRGIQESTGLTDRQVYGIAAGIVLGALVADMMGGGGLTTIALASGGGALGNWVMGD
jgi:hypothetical protein